MSRALSLEVVAEGVETEAQRDRLVALGCRVLQGYLYGKPMSAEDAERMLAAAHVPVPVRSAR